MANSPFLKFRLAGMDEIKAVLKQLPDDLRRKVLQTAVGRAAGPLVAAAKANAQGSRRTGALVASLGAIVKKGKDGTPYAAVGPRTGRYKSGKKLKAQEDGKGAAQPSKYAHLVEFGHHTAAKSGVTPAALAKGTKGKTRRKGTLYAQAFVLPKPFLRPALLTAHAAVAEEMAKGVEEGIARQLDRLVKKPKAAR